MAGLPIQMVLHIVTDTFETIGGEGDIVAVHNSQVSVALFHLSLWPL